MIRALNITIILFLIWFLNSSFQEKQLNNLSANEIIGTDSRADYYSENLEIRQYGEQGKLQSLIKTERLVHFPDQQIATLISPALELYSEAGTVKKASSREGFMLDQNQNLNLLNNVSIEVTNSDHQQVLEIATSSLTYSSEQKRLWTDSDSTGVTAEGSFQSKKLSMDVKTDQLQLKDKVHIHYQRYDLQIVAGKLTNNPQTNLSRLENNVVLSHKDMIIKGDNAEVQSLKNENSKIFVISGTPVKLEQTLENGKMFANAGELVYLPDEQRMEFEHNVNITQKSADVHFNILANNLQLLFTDDAPSALNAQGNPVKFSHKLPDGTVRIESKNIAWNSKTNIAILEQATVFDKGTTFSAEEIKYNTLTGETSAIGTNDSRPNYKYSPEKEKGKTE